MAPVHCRDGSSLEVPINERPGHVSLGQVTLMTWHLKTGLGSPLRAGSGPKDSPHKEKRAVSRLGQDLVNQETSLG